MQVLLVSIDQDTADMAEIAIRIRWADAKFQMAATAKEGLEIAEQISPDVVLLSPRFPDMSLTDMIQGLRRVSLTPMLVLGEGREMEVVIALEMGADDFVRVPVELTELMARVGALLRRADAVPSHETEKPVQSGALFINPATYEVFLDNRPVTLTSMEFRALYALINKWGSVVTHQTMEQTIWGSNANSSGLVKKYIQRLRQKLGDSFEDSSWIASVHGVGYRFVGPKPEYKEFQDPALVTAG